VQKQKSLSPLLLRGYEFLSRPNRAPLQALACESAEEKLCLDFNEVQSADGQNAATTSLLKIAHSLGIWMISIIMIHSPIAGAIMDRSERKEILQQTLPKEKQV
jgi:hypothetical protein